MLARHLELSTTAFTETYLENGPYLSHNEDGSCVFLGRDGCTVHAARPLVCRLYPLARYITPDQKEYFSHMQPHPESEGEYGERGTVDDFLKSQRALPFIAAADRYLELFRKMFAAVNSDLSLQEDTNVADTMRAHAGVNSAPPPELLDPDRAIRLNNLNHQTDRPDPETAMALHIAAIETWLSSRLEENSDE